MVVSDDEANPPDEITERSIEEEENESQNRRKYSIEPPFLEKKGRLEGGSVSEDMRTGEARAESSDDYEDLSSDKEKDTTEGEITDTETSA